MRRIRPRSAKEKLVGGREVRRAIFHSNLRSPYFSPRGSDEPFRGGIAIGGSGAGSAPSERRGGGMGPRRPAPSERGRAVLNGLMELGRRLARASQRRIDGLLEDRIDGRPLNAASCLSRGGIRAPRGHRRFHRFYSPSSCDRRGPPVPADNPLLPIQWLPSAIRAQLLDRLSGLEIRRRGDRSCRPVARNRVARALGWTTSSSSESHRTAIPRSPSPSRTPRLMSSDCAC